MSLAAREAGSAERHALVDRHPVADLGRLADHDAGAVVDERLGADARGRVDLDPGDRPGRVGERERHDRHARLVKRVGHAVDKDRLHTAPAGEDLERPDAARGRIALARGREVAADLAADLLQKPEPEHRGNATA